MRATLTVLILLVIPILSGCRTSATVVANQHQYASFRLEKDYRDSRRIRITKHDRTFPAGTYIATYEDDRGIYYMSREGYFIDHVQKDRKIHGGIFVSHDRSEAMVHEFMGGGDPGALGVGGVEYLVVGSLLAPKQGTPFGLIHLPEALLETIVWIAGTAP